MVTIIEVFRSVLYMTVYFVCLAVSPVRAAAGPPTICALRPPGASKEKTPSCRTLHHQEYVFFCQIYPL